MIGLLPYQYCLCHEAMSPVLAATGGTIPADASCMGAAAARMDEAIRFGRRQRSLSEPDATGRSVLCWRMEPTHPETWFIAVGASGAEGLGDIKQLMSELPSSLPAVVMIVLHRPWDRPSHLQSVLAKASKMPVHIAVEGERFEPGNAYIGEPADHLTLAARSFGDLVADPDRLYRNRTVDLLFHSVAAHGKACTIGVILSGSLDDGARGLAAIHAAGGLTMVLTPDAPPGRGMPENAISYDGPIDVIGGPHQIAAALQDAVAGKRA